MKFCQNFDMDDSNVDHEGQGHQVKKCYVRSYFTILQVIV